MSCQFCNATNQYDDEVCHKCGRPTASEPSGCSGPSALLFLILVALLVVFCTSCTLKVGADGSRTWNANGEEIARALIIISEK